MPAAARGSQVGRWYKGGTEHAESLSGRGRRTLALPWAGEVGDMTWISLLLLLGVVCCRMTLLN
jgi:hypothetical protein